MRRRPCARLPVLGGGEPGRKERLRRLDQQRRRGAPQPQHDHRGDHPARRDRRLRRARPGRGPAPTAMRSTARTRWRSARTARASTSPRSSATPWRASTATRPPGRSPSPPGAAGCVSETGAGPCANGHALDGANSVAVSPDGKSVYVASSLSNAVARLNRNTTTGAITQPAGTAGCISETGAGPCADGHGLDGPISVAVSPDGKSVYVASVGSNAVARLTRNTTTGAITQPAGTAGCVSETGAGPCADGHALGGPSDGGGQPGREERLRRLAPTATPWRASTATRPPGRSPSPPGPPVASARPGRGPAPTATRSTPRSSVAVSPDGKSVYVASGVSEAVARLNRNTTTGAITQPAGTAGCVSETGAGPCADGHGLDGPQVGGGEPGRKERLRRLPRHPRQRCRGALQPSALGQSPGARPAVGIYRSSALR